MGFARKMYGLWVMGQLWVMGPIYVVTNVVTPKTYGILGGMGYLGYGLRGRRLYVLCGHDV